LARDGGELIAILSLGFTDSNNADAGLPRRHRGGASGQGEGQDQFHESAHQQADAEQGRSDEDRGSGQSQHHDAHADRQQTDYQPPFPQPLRYRSIHDGPRFIEDHGFDASVVSTDSSIIDLVTAGVDIAADNTTYRLM
jgi:hypothetical protein